MRGRYSMTDHVLTRLVGVLIVAATLGPWVQGSSLSAGGPLLETVGLSFLVGVVLLGAIEGIAQGIRIFVIPRGPGDSPR